MFKIISKDKKFVENTIDELYVNNSENSTLYSSRLAIERSIAGRITYEMALQLEKGVNIIRKYDFGEIWNKDCGISVSLKKVSKNIWIPEPVIVHFSNLVKTENIPYQILVADEVNSFSSVHGSLDENEFNLIKRVAYCSDDGQQYSSVGRKTMLFLENPVWRNATVEYSILLLKSIKEGNYILKRQNSEKELTTIQTNALKSVDVLTSMYLEQMK
jgi:hypothetical protein